MEAGVLVPPYRRIADQIRARIEAGELVPGDRVPSSRAITREWGVAIATATKALAALRDEGLTVPRPGVGTVVARTKVPRKERDLTLERVVRAAIAIADAHGMGELSMRRVAAELGVATMSLYRHVPSKDELVLLMIDVAFGEQLLPAELPAGWRASLELAARVQWSAFRRHPWLAPSMSLTRPQMSPNAMRLTEWVLASFDGTGLTLEDRMYAHILMFSFVRGVASALEPEAEAIRETGLTNDQWIEERGESFESLIDAHAMANFREVTRDGFDFDLDALFRFGLDRLLDGLEVFVRAKISSRARSQSSRRSRT
jgi:DNA-binding transcriptional regulator YhcF (GntR family)